MSMEKCLVKHSSTALIRSKCRKSEEQVLRWPLGTQRATFYDGRTSVVSLRKNLLPWSALRTVELEFSPNNSWKDIVRYICSLLCYNMFYKIFLDSICILKLPVYHIDIECTSSYSTYLCAFLMLSDELHSYIFAYRVSLLLFIIILLLKHYLVGKINRPVCICMHNSNCYWV